MPDQVTDHKEPNNRRCNQPAIQVLHSSEIPQSNCVDDVNNCENREGITEWPVYHMPQMKYPFRLVEKQDPLGERCFLSHQLYNNLDVLIAGGKQPADGTNHLPERGRLATHPCNLEGTPNIEKNHLSQRCQQGTLANLLCRRHGEDSRDLGLRVYRLPFQRICQCVLVRRQFLERRLGSVQ